MANANINTTIFQHFHWYTPNDGSLWQEAAENAKALSEAGFTAVWLPPAYKAMNGANDVGYGVYDLYDLGEFHQKGTVRTKYGTRQQYLAAVRALQHQGLHVYADTVLNHRMGGDVPETVNATPYHKHNRSDAAGQLQEIQSYTHFHFPGRKNKYSDFKWHWHHFDAVDYNHYEPTDNDTIYLLEGKRFDDYVAQQYGNFAYLMGCDVDYQNRAVREELIQWGKWYLDTTGVDGFRLDAIKHISAWFFPEWIAAMEEHVGHPLFFVGEYWINELTPLQRYLQQTNHQMAIFDVPLHYTFHQASRAGNRFEMWHLLNNSFTQAAPTHAVTFVENHDSQPLQALESVVEPWFKPLAYAFILLRQGGTPCVFYADYYGAEYKDWDKYGQHHNITMPSHRWIIDKFLDARQNHAYGKQHDYFDHPNTVGWTRLGDETHPKALAVLMTNGDDGHKWMDVGRPNAQFIDTTEHIDHPIYTNEWGWGEFKCLGGSVSVWVEK